MSFLGESNYENSGHWEESCLRVHLACRWVAETYYARDSSKAMSVVVEGLAGNISILCAIDSPITVCSGPFLHMSAGHN